MRRKRCPATRCPRLIPATARYCPEHTDDYERRRGSARQRGYGAEHDRLRAKWQARMDAGETVWCARCGSRIESADPWALDHTDDRTGYLGPSHAACNNRAGGQAAHR